MKTSRVEFKRVANGQFECYLDGKLTGYQIVNGSLGLSGRDTRNMYGIVKPNKDVKWLGPLRTCKLAVECTLTKESK